MRLILKQNENILYELNAMGVNDVKVHEDKGHEVLEIVVHERESIFLKIKPSISLNQKIDEKT